uniref:Histone H2A n=1 Tax=Ditylum brightwellii TaxID=49249 RepID=A0A7S4W4X2_9STRA|mmetsp:Transcript_41830/g.63234  ORF Transcript_41830/g.63234 Transcript_41830/m.63234 type:complete len:113 (+) Transcript_41830:10-348(+)
MSGKERGGRGGKKSAATSAKAGLQFPVGRTRRLKPKIYSNCMKADDSVYFAVLECLCADIPEIPYDAACIDKKSHIVQGHVTQEATKEEELNKLFGEVAIAIGDANCYCNKG